MKSDYRVRAEKFLHSVYPFIKDCILCPWDVEMRINSYNNRMSRHVRCEFGSARICLILSDYVVKWDYDEDAVSEIGGCVDEFNIYARAIQDGFEYLFAEPTLIEIDGMIFSIMPRINNIGPHGHYGDITHYTTEREYEWLRDLGLASDLHDWNWGTRYRKACIVDYACTNDVW